MSQVESSKVLLTVAVGSDSDEIATSKVVMFAILTPSDEDDDSYRAVTVNTRIIRRN